MDESISLRDPVLAARAANTAYAQARMIFEAEPQITAADLVALLRLQADAAQALADAHRGSGEKPMAADVPARQGVSEETGLAGATAERLQGMGESHWGRGEDSVEEDLSRTEE